MNAEYKNKIQEKTKIFVTNKIKDVKFVDEILSLLNIDIRDYDIGDHKKTYENFRQCKKILQLIINAHNDFDMYRNYTFKLAVEKHDSSALWQSCYDYDRTYHLWRCIIRPSVEIVTEVILDYLLCYVSIFEKETVSIGNDDTQKIDKCPFCDEDLRYGDKVCGLCNSPLSEILRFSNDQRKKKEDLSRNHDVLESKHNETKKNDVLPHINRINNIEEEHKARDFQDQRKQQSILQTAVMTDKWICGGCECYNAYSMICCEACGGLLKDGVWHCKKCTAKNRGVNNVCEACGTNNDGIVVDMIFKGACHRDVTDGRTASNHDDLDVGMDVDTENIPKHQWYCGKCGTYHSYNVNQCVRCRIGRNTCGKWRCQRCTLINDCPNRQCDTCGIQNDLYIQKQAKCDKTNKKKNKKKKNGPTNQERAMNSPESIKVKDENISHSWHCEGCTYLNKGSDKICTVCGKNLGFRIQDQRKCDDNNNKEKNKNDSKTVEKPKKNSAKFKDKMEIKDDKWECDYFNCGNKNNAKDEYCSICKMYRHVSHVVGDVVRKQTKKGIEEGWVCPGCNKFNQLTSDMCGGKGCPRLRYDPMICIGCKASSTVRTKECLQCQRPF